MQDVRQAAVTHLTQQVAKSQRQYGDEHPVQNGTQGGQPEGLAGCSPLMVRLLRQDVIQIWSDG